MIGDMHCHTTMSDGSTSPEMLVQFAVDAGLDFIAVTDHDTMDGALEMDKLVTEEFRFIRGIEFSCETPAGKCHILGYDYDPSDPLFLSALAEGAALRQEKLRDRQQYLEATLHITFTEAELAWIYSQKSPGKPHFAKLLVDRGIAETIDEAIQKFINPHKPRRDRITGHTAVAAILHAGGIPVWAHPLGGEGEKRLTVEKFQVQLDYLIGQGIRGLECHYSRYCRSDIEFLTAQTQRHGLLISGGSDYHGAVKKNLPLGQLSADGAAVHPETLSILKML